MPAVRPSGAPMSFRAQQKGWPKGSTGVERTIWRVSRSTRSTFVSGWSVLDTTTTAVRPSGATEAARHQREKNPIPDCRRPAALPRGDVEDLEVRVLTRRKRHVVPSLPDAHAPGDERQLGPARLSRWRPVHECARAMQVPDEDGAV